MAFVLVEKGIVIQKQPHSQEGFIEAPDGVTCGFVYEDGNFTAPKIPIDWPSVIAAKRYEIETAGTTVEGMLVKTDRDSQALITGAAIAAMLDAGYSIRWKTAVGFVELTGAQVLGLASAVRAYVQACFDREAELRAAAENGSILEIMIEEGWPK